MSFRGQLIKAGIDSNGTDIAIFDGTLTLQTDNKLIFRDSGCFIHSNADGYLTIEADTGIVIAAPVSITGALTYTGTLSIGTAAIGIDFTGTYTTTGIRMGTSGVGAIALAAYDDHLIDIYATCAVASNSGNAVSAFQLYSTTTGTQSEDWTMSVTSYTDIYSGNENTVGHFYSEWGTTDGIGPLGMASAVTGKMLLPTAMTGSFFPFYAKINFQADPGFTPFATPGNTAAWFLLSIGGVASGKNDFDDNGNFMEIHNITAGAGHLLSASSITMRCAVPSAGAIKYLMLSDAEDCLDFEAANGVTIAAGITLSRTGTGKYTDGILISGACDDNGIEITGSCTDSAIQTGTGTFGTGILLGGTITTGVSIGACATVAINITGASVDGIIIAGAMSSNGVEVTGVCTGAGVFLGTTNKLMFHDTGMYIRASADGHLEIVSDDTITLSSPGHGSIVFGGETDWGAGTNGHDIDGSGYDWCTQTVAHVDSGALGASCAAAYHALTVNTTSHTTTSSFFGTWTELYLIADCILTGSSNSAAIWGQVEGLGAFTTPDSGDFVAAAYFNMISGAQVTLTTGSSLNGVRVKGEVHSVTGSGIFAAIEVLAVTTDWTYGLYLSNITTGIVINACTTGISVPANTVIPQFLTIGTSGNGVHWAGAASNWLVFTNHTSATPGSNSCYKFQLEAIQGEATTSGRLECLRGEVITNSTWAVASSMRGVVSQLTFSGAMTYTGQGPNGAIALIGSIYSAATSHLTCTGGAMYPLGLFWGVGENSSFSGGESAFIYCYTHGLGTAPESIIRTEEMATKQLVTYFLDIHGQNLTSGGFCDATSKASSQGSIKIRLGAVNYYIPIFT